MWQAFDSLMIRGEGAADGYGAPSDVALGVLHHLLLQFEELWPFTWGHWMHGAPPIWLCGAAGGLAGSLLFMLGRPDSRFSCLMLAVHSTLITPMALGLLLALTTSVTLTPFSAFTLLLPLIPCPIKFLLSIFTPDPWTPTVPNLLLITLGASFIEGIMGVWLGRRLGSLALLYFEQGGLLFGQCFVMAPLVLVVQVSNTSKGQLNGGYWLHQDLASLIQHLAQVGQLVADWSFLLAKVRRLPRWYGGNAQLGGLPQHHPFCQFEILLIDVKYRVVWVIVVLLLLWLAAVAGASASCMATCSNAMAAGQSSCNRQTVSVVSMLVLMSSSSSRSALLSNSSLWKYWSTTSCTSAGSTRKFLGTMDTLISPRGCINPWPPVGNWEAYCPWVSGS